MTDTQDSTHSQLLAVITKYFNKTELKEFCFKLDLLHLFDAQKEFDDIAIDLITYHARRNDLMRLQDVIQRARPQADFEWVVLPLHKPVVDIYHLPQPTTPLVGRAAESAQLDAGFASPDTAIVGLIAPGGVGKSALTHEWLARLQKRDWGRARRVFGWSFYSQGTHDTQTVSTQFLDEALRFFGLTGNLPKSDEQKARALARRLREMTFVLVLDGIEPLQYPVDVLRGGIKDLGLRTLLRDIRAHGLEPQQLVVLSSRQPVVELVGCASYVPIDLATLSAADGATVLRGLGVQGLSANLEQAATAFGGHALALVLLGNVLAEYYDGDVNQYTQVDMVAEKETVVSSHAERVMLFYEQELWSATTPERVFLMLLGLFDRPMGDAELQLLVGVEHRWFFWEEPRLLFAEMLVDVPDTEIQRVVKRLHKLGLLLDTPSGYDTHPLIRAYFGHRLQAEPLDSWQTAHQLLFEHFQKIPAKKYPDTLEQLEPLYRAVHHGCLAGLYREALLLYRERILRGSEAYSTRQLGAIAANLAAIADFFPSGWTQPVTSELPETEYGWLLGEASFCLMSLGRLTEAITPRLARIQLCEELQDWENAVSSAINLAELYLLLGRLPEAIETTQHAIKWSAQMNEQFWQMLSRYKLAATLHRQSAISHGSRVFAEAEQLQQQWQPESPCLYSIQGAEYCELLLEIAQSQTSLTTVLRRAEYMHKYHKESKNTGLLDFAYNFLIFGQTQAQLNQPQASFQALQQAIDGVRQAGHINYIPHFLLTRANIYRQYHHHAAAQTDLQEAEEIIDICGMRLYAVDAALLRGNLALDQSPDLPTAQTSLHHAQQDIRAIHYHQRDVECALLAVRLHHAQNQPQQAQQQLQNAYDRMAVLGQWGLRNKWEMVKAEVEQ